MGSRTMTIDRVLDMSEQLSTTDQLRLISLLSDRLRREIAPEDEPVNILSTVGLGAEVWQGIDVAAYLEEERASWDR
jgi:hypothetical protein